MTEFLLIFYNISNKKISHISTNFKVSTIKKNTTFSILGFTHWLNVVYKVLLLVSLLKIIIIIYLIKKYLQINVGIKRRR